MKEFEKLVQDMREEVKVPENVQGKCEEVFLMLEEGESRNKIKDKTKKKRLIKRVFAGAGAIAACVCMALLGNQSTPEQKQEENRFGMNVYAAETNEDGMEMKELENEAKVFSMICPGSSDAHYIDCLFEIDGNNIKSVSGSIDKGEFYRFEYAEMTSVEYENMCLQGGADGENYTYNGYFYKLRSAGYCEQIGNEFEEEYNSEVYYGFYLPDITSDISQDLREEYHANIDQLDGAIMTITVTYYDDTTESVTYKLSTGKLDVDLPHSYYYGTFVTDGQSGGTYGVLLEPQE
ncbi:MAG: hypothetical protein IJA32_04690 [Lachnospiraceae bacterium]|nr:hypothetical protein [Lachnospiraceae bacterium]